MTGKIKTVAVVGLGHGITHIREGYATNGDLFKVLALCDLNTERLTQAAQDYKVERTTTSFDELLTMPDLDIIDICTPPSLHRDQVISALEAGKHVVCEKPLVGSLADVDDVIAVEARAKGVLMPIFQCRFGDGIGQVKAILDAGLAGKPYVASVETLWTRTPEYYAVPWRGKWATELGGVLATHAIHAHDLLTYLLGPIVRVFGRIDTRVNAIEVEDCVSASLADGEWRACVAERDPGLAAADHPPTAGLRKRHLRKLARSLPAGHRLVANHPGVGGRQEPDRCLPGGTLGAGAGDVPGADGAVSSGADQTIPRSRSPRRTHDGRSSC